MKNKRVTIYTTCKPFEGQTAYYQRMAIFSWRNLGFDVLILGDEDGAAEISDELGCSNIRDVKYSASGIPLVSSLFATARENSNTEYLCYLNADIILGRTAPIVFTSFMDANLKADHKLLLCKRTNVPFFAQANGDEANLKDIWTLKEEFGVLDRPDAIDMFFYDCNLYSEIPPFEVGRMQWDNWLLDEAIRNEAAIVDASGVLDLLHPFHDYEGGFGQILFGDNTRSNQQLSSVSGENLDTASTYRVSNDNDLYQVEFFDGIASGNKDVESTLHIESKAFLHFFKTYSRYVSYEKKKDAIKQFLWRNKIYFPFMMENDASEQDFLMLTEMLDCAKIDDIVYVFQDFICSALLKKLRQYQDDGKDICIWGTGELAKRIMHWFNREKVTFTAFIDRKTDVECLYDKKILQPQDLNEIPQKPFIVIASMYFRDIGKDLEKLGFHEFEDYIG